MNIGSLGSILEELLGSINYNPADSDMYPFFVRLGCVKYRPPRHEFFDYFREMGSQDLIPIIYHKKVRMPSHLVLIFPERHLSVHEQQSMMSRINSHPQVDELKQVDIITSCPLIVSDFLNYMCVILTWPDDEKEKQIIPFDR